MAVREISMALMGLALASIGSCDFGFPRFRSFSESLGAADSIRRSWFLSPEPSLHLDSYPFDSLKHGTEHIAAFKKIPTEDKAPRKKPVPPFYSLPEDPKIKEMILKSGAPYCQEITAKDSKAGVDEKQMTCYRCKDPKNGSSYEHCSYSSQPSSSSSRGTRSNAALEKSPDSLGAGSQPRGKSADKLPEAFRFSEDYFHPEASHELPAEYEKNIDNCERVVRDSMVCMVCKEPKTSGKYEQCSYVAQPNEKAYAYSKSSSFGGAKPRDEAPKEAIHQKRRPQPEARNESEESQEQEEGEEEPEAADHLHYKHEEPEDHRHPHAGWSDEKEGHGSHYVPEHSYHYPSHYGSYEAEEDESPKQSANSEANCKTLQKDGQSCTVCTNPKTGGKSEQCNYSHEPKDKVYKYSKSKSFGYPESTAGKKHQSSSSSSDDEDKSPESSEKREASAESSGYGSYETEPSTLDYIRSESEKISKQVKGQGDCRKVKRDDELCTVCKDPKTGGENEQCSYSYEPEDKVFAYSKSKSFGSPTKSSPGDEEYGSSASEERPEESYSSPVIFPTGTSPLDYIPKTSESQLSSVYTTGRPHQDEVEKLPKKQGDRVDSGFYDATLRRAEIEKIVKDIGSEDRSKCKKMYRNGMTCYSCADEQGFVNEECVFVNEPGEASGTVVEVTVEPTTTTTTTTTTSSTTKLLEPLQTSSSWKPVQVSSKNRKTRATAEKEKQPKDKDEELEVLDEELDEAEPYDYVAETRPVYDKILGITLPAYMITKSAQEAEFDEYVEKAKF